MTDRRAFLRASGSAALGATVLGAFLGGGSPAQALAAHQPLPDPATTPVPNPPLPHGLTPQEHRNLITFDELDFDVFSHARWDRLRESHARDIRVHWPDGHYTDGIEPHIADLKAMFAWAPDTRIQEHPLRVAHNEFTAVVGVMRGTFTRPMPDGAGGSIPPNGRQYAISMATIGIWNRKGTMSEEFLFWDNLTFNRQLGLA
ncbi:ester cyclase [Saccharothrix coeruleofusca]|uniref:SnoaL-like polyketide cyclase n=1 Tax=Saccharothrix coeruleofusca TaxID=33919 RepID=A0A918AHY0_9PSEU|nr:ester cyclase [Saccharothrix coeruleofusca]MBP2334274.1 hypothetical protein [Saccharothrix coeruleofusca]GGP42242.1 hypothetical protein GCM10010185_12030 [Saccharothrix coeruleofusca]